ncbi:DNA repair protein RecO [Thermodesulfovibrio yellowstonii]|uniref:DNA repair protein RecO n=1 Tax=Thermodesulfovibrio yellowstonii TaxID=28262 RepID=A0A9W6GFF3_9BACT|nr:DNA repair protein RecO [Thermodesulfovibrio islandicus]GLI54293.1 DNA repair protein RecO [Thermodesulfovibrio islandicus]
MHYSTEAIVLKNIPYGEADLIVTYLTKNYGLLNLFAKSPRKIKSRFGSSLEPLTYSEISFIGKEDNLQKIIQSDIIHSFQTIRENYRLFLRIANTLRFLIQALPKKEPNSELFYLLLNMLFYLEKSTKPDNYILFLKVRGLSILGYLPDFKNCGVCRQELKEEFYYSSGFIICKKCSSSYNYSSSTLPIPISQGVIKLLNEMSRWTMNFLERVRISDKLSNEMEKFIQSHISTVLGYNKTWDTEKSIIAS